MDNKTGNKSSSMNITSDRISESGIIMNPNIEPGAQSVYSATIITPADSLIVAAAESFPRGTSDTGGGSGFSDRMSHLGSSITHMLSDFTHTITERAHETLDMVTHADYKGMVDDTRRGISANPERTLAVAAGLGITLGLLASSRRKGS